MDSSPDYCFTGILANPPKYLAGGSDFCEVFVEYQINLASRVLPAQKLEVKAP